jgi:mycothiol system anti-sigma-R factor
LSCEQRTENLHAYLDGELDAAGTRQFERHMKECPECGAALAAERKLQNSLQSSGLYENAPKALRQRVVASLPALPEAKTKKAGEWRWAALVLACLIGAFLMWQLFSDLGGRSRQSVVAAAVVDAHLRSLQPGHQADVVSTDQHTVKPWFDGKLDIAPPVRDFTAEGFPLTGGRLDVIHGRTVAALVYGRRKHVVNVFVWKAGDDEDLSGAGEQQGYHWLAWQKDGLNFVGVSDVAAEDLAALRDLFLKG